ncbi:hypothetical protein B188_20670 [Candidatus Brocadiaceae bacterium B188]|nr:hypothetical protein B188_20670 [Candidatus Brocadiaceae bacterium B188]
MIVSTHAVLVHKKDAIMPKTRFSVITYVKYPGWPDMC